MKTIQEFRRPFVKRGRPGGLGWLRRELVVLLVGKEGTDGEAEDTKVGRYTIQGSQAWAQTSVQCPELPNGHSAGSIREGCGQDGTCTTLHYCIVLHPIVSRTKAHQAGRHWHSMPISRLLHENGASTCDLAPYTYAATCSALPLYPMPSASMTWPRRELHTRHAEARLLDHALFWVDSSYLRPAGLNLFFDTKDAEVARSVDLSKAVPRRAVDGRLLQHHTGDWKLKTGDWRLETGDWIGFNITGGPTGFLCIGSNTVSVEKPRYSVGNPEAGCQRSNHGESPTIIAPKGRQGRVIALIGCFTARSRKGAFYHPIPPTLAWLGTCWAIGSGNLRLYVALCLTQYLRRIVVLSERVCCLLPETDHRMLIVSGTCAYETNASRYPVTARNSMIPERHILVGCCLAGNSRCSSRKHLFRQPSSQSQRDFKEHHPAKLCVKLPTSQLNANRIPASCHRRLRLCRRLGLSLLSSLSSLNFGLAEEDVNSHNYVPQAPILFPKCSKYGEALQHPRLLMDRHLTVTIATSQGLLALKRNGPNLDPAQRRYLSH
ncbi:uncharacterized protein LY79DRAFT_686692 [Colletotrichum navitas]|uniref:Uncharacterized protein n=1 Tax=Colletotrichum navitas TaxID=681940 RepID=A0AAD8PZ40_9PEZI|nr:uncharacterized protein LY79DRAFT_686692 [Colletotrichum navitas]KAK1590789.1 hypothetical protein LY79DRAFT_686692 [Colletotrichum navitas]